MEAYQTLIDHLIRVLEETAKLTRNPWDDAAAQAARGVFVRLFTKPLLTGTESEIAHHEVFLGQVGGLPTWLVPIVVELASHLLKLLLKKESA